MAMDEGYRVVTEGKALVNGTSETFQQLKAEIGQIGEQIESISSSLDEIQNQTIHIQQFLKDTTALSEQMAACVSEVSAIAGAFRQYIEEVAGSVSDLDREAGKLNGMVNQFRCTVSASSAAADIFQWIMRCFRPGKRRRRINIFKRENFYTIPYLF